jgi:hypothetical protein
MRRTTEMPYDSTTIIGLDASHGEEIPLRYDPHIQVNVVRMGGVVYLWCMNVAGNGQFVGIRLDRAGALEYAKALLDAAEGEWYASPE